MTVGCKAGLEFARVVQADPQNDARWESFVAAHPDGSIYHHPAWLRALSEEYGQQGIYLACEDHEGNFLALMPMLYTRGLPFGVGGPLTSRRLSSLPRTPVAGPLSIDQDATAAILQAAVSRVSAAPGIQLQIKTQGRELDGLLPEVACTPWRLSYLLERPPDSAGPYRVPDGGDRAKIKWSINKATKMGVRVRPAETKEELREWYLLYLETMRRNSVPPRSYRFFGALWELLRPTGMMELLLAELDDPRGSRVLAGSIFFKFHRTVSFAFSGSRRTDLPLRANDLIQWKAINDAFTNGYERFDFGEVPDGNDSLAKFKSKWGAEPIRMYRYYYPAPPAPTAAARNSAWSMSAVAHTMWTRLPLSTTAWLGDRIYKYL